MFVDISGEQTESKSDGGLSTGEIVGIVFGCIGGVIFLFFLGVLCTNDKFQREVKECLGATKECIKKCCKYIKERFKK